jgi:hypothetical protein
MSVLETIALFLKRVAGFFNKSNLENSTAPEPTESGAIVMNASTAASTTLTIDAHFNPAQAEEISAAMGVIFQLFGGAEKFYARTGLTELKFVYPKELSSAVGNAVADYIGNGVIEMSAAAFNAAPLIPGWYIAHEVGHVFDFSRSRGKPRLYRSQAFVNHFVPRSWWQRLLGLPGGKLIGNVGYQGKNWTGIAKESGASIRGQLNSAEDFADTFAVVYAVTVTHSGLPYRSFNSPWRFEKVKAMIEGAS